jgi:hypothetical protein
MPVDINRRENCERARWPTRNPKKLTSPNESKLPVVNDSAKLSEAGITERAVGSRHEAGRRRTMPRIVEHAKDAIPFPNEAVVRWRLEFRQKTFSPRADGVSYLCSFRQSSRDVEIFFSAEEQASMNPARYSISALINLTPGMVASESIPTAFKNMRGSSRESLTDWPTRLSGSR